MNDLLKQGNRWKKEADKILANSGLEDILKKFGEVEFSGAYVADPMMNGDIDIYAVNKSFTKKKVLEILNQLVNFCPLQGYLFYDWKLTNTQIFPPSIILA